MCYNPLLVHDKPLLEPAFVKRVLFLLPPFIYLSSNASVHENSMAVWYARDTVVCFHKAVFICRKDI